MFTVLDTFCTLNDYKLKIFCMIISFPSKIELGLPNGVPGIINKKISGLKDKVRSDNGLLRMGYEIC